MSASRPSSPGLPKRLHLLLTFEDTGRVIATPVLPAAEDAVELERRVRRLVMTLVENPAAIARITGLADLQPAQDRRWP